VAAPDPSDPSDWPDPSEGPDQSDHDQPDSPSSAAPVGLDILTIGLLIFFIALIGIVAALLLLPILAG
jgi:hypothetical protein